VIRTLTRTLMRRGRPHRKPWIALEKRNGKIWRAQDFKTAMEAAVYLGFALITGEELRREAKEAS